MEIGERNSFQTHIIYKDADTFEVIRAATEILGKVSKLIVIFEVLKFAFPHICLFIIFFSY